MKNFEKYEPEIRGLKDYNFCSDFVIPNILKSNSCAGIYCSECGRRQLLWFLEDSEKPETDWGKVEVDTPILVRNSEYGEWFKRHFAEYKNGKVYTWDNGYTSWTACGYMGAWNYAKLTEEEKEGKEPEIDWGEVEIDTPILVRDHEDTESVTVPWLKRYFAEYKDGLVYTWVNGRTSWNEDCTHWWKYAKLAENEENK